VQYISGNIAHVFSNRAAMEAYIYDHCEQDGRKPEFYQVSVWSIDDTWPADQSDLIERAIAKVKAGAWSIERGAEESGMSTLEFEALLFEDEA
jgi:hypothetical protein